ncbi:hypothetical protein M409DRAFT_53850 [Zasmidium cellare ATCC 36951]|uniref:BTB domain-containing protein n=1 Tax=Zasmidium cellare ATCC 36951 TaxID=1080233 RepID=A0A6A6CLI0_ZASCE|nr:uncharacterized protein M409DRAFT_53850 [Zasmidium cellare ATCC 36951]KAF2167901.1 hypothetical protein M409DRAFT_53850 [Zasmidium cellare ATCC 36951]
MDADESGDLTAKYITSPSSSAITLLMPSRFSGATVTLVVGDSEAILCAHESLLKQNSAFFRTALDKDWKERKTREITLPDDEVTIVVGYLEWLYCSKLTTPKDDEKNYDHHTGYVWLTKAYIFGDKVQDDAFCDEIISNIARLMDTPINGMRYYPTCEALQLIYSSTPKHSPIRQMMVSILAARATPAILGRDFLSYPQEFLLELLLEMSARRPQLKVRSAYDMRQQWFKKV